MREGERLDDLQRNGWQIIQNPEKFCFGMDAVLLAGFARIRAGSRVLDLGTGNGILPLLLAARTKAAELIGLEIQEESADMARRSVALNGLTDRIRIITGDIKSADELFPKASFEAVVSNPPYMIAGHGLSGKRDARTIARHEVLCTLEDVVRQAAQLLAPGGNFFMVHRPFRLAEILNCLCRYGLEPKRLRLVYPYADREPNMVLVEANRGGRPRMLVEKPLIIYEKTGKYSQEILDLYSF